MPYKQRVQYWDVERQNYINIVDAAEVDDKLDKYTFSQLVTATTEFNTIGTAVHFIGQRYNYVTGLPDTYNVELVAGTGMTIAYNSTTKQLTFTAAASSGVNSVTGTMVDNTDPVNPVVNSDATKVDKLVYSTPNSVQIINDGVKFEAIAANGTTTSFSRVLADEVDLISQTDSIGSESAIYTYDTYAIMERKKYSGTPGTRTFISQQFYLEDGQTRPQYDYKTGGDGLPTINNVKNIAFLEDFNWNII